MMPPSTDKEKDRLLAGTLDYQRQIDALETFNKELLDKLEQAENYIEKLKKYREGFKVLIDIITMFQTQMNLVMSTLKLLNDQINSSIYEERNK